MLASCNQHHLMLENVADDIILLQMLAWAAIADKLLEYW